MDPTPHGSPANALPDATNEPSATVRGEPHDSDRLIELVYGELRGLAAAWLAAEAPGQTLQATGLVHEAYLRLVGGDPVQVWAGRSHFFAAAARVMRRILVENARAKNRFKRGGGRSREVVELDQIVAPGAPEALLALDEALDRLKEVDSQAAEVVQLRVFGGLTVKEAADVLGVAPRTVDYSWSYARAWLLAELRGNAE